MHLGEQERGEAALRGCQIFVQEPRKPRIRQHVAVVGVDGYGVMSLIRLVEADGIAADGVAHAGSRGQW